VLALSISFSKLYMRLILVTGKGSGHRPEQSDMNAEREAAQPMAFRGDARWLGLARAQSADILAGLSSSGHVFVATMDHAGALSGV
jgi:hypothetical protein